MFISDRVLNIIIHEFIVRQNKNLLKYKKKMKNSYKNFDCKKNIMLYAHAIGKNEIKDTLALSESD